MPLTISDDVLNDLNMDEREARVEIACRLFDAGKLGKSRAARLAGLTRPDFEDELRARKLPVIHVDEGYWKQELESLQEWERRERDGK
jgi:predicted HTH domain antitoxin